MMDLAPVIERQEGHDLVNGAAQTAATTDISFGAVLRGHPRLSELLDEDALDRLPTPPGTTAGVRRSLPRRLARRVPT